MNSEKKYIVLIPIEVNGEITLAHIVDGYGYSTYGEPPVFTRKQAEYMCEIFNGTIFECDDVTEMEGV